MRVCLPFSRHRRTSLLALAAAAALMAGGGPAPRERAGRDGAPMVYVPAGDFWMGSTPAETAAGAALCARARPDCRKAAFSAERPRKRVHLAAFYIAKFEVTNENFLRAGMRPAMDLGPRFNGLRQPVVGVTWEQARAYCEKAGGRLPTEAEWEKAARGERGRAFPWGSAPPDGRRANFCDVNCANAWKSPSADDGHPVTAPVGSYPAGVGPYGALDMAGNAWEWVADWYREDAYRSAQTRDPTGPLTGRERVLRGGGWGNHPAHLRAAFRIGADPAKGYPSVGFRCAASAP